MHYRIVVEGRVQGVGYRAFVQGVAKELGIKGFVRNLAGGSVEIVCDCEEGDLNDFLKRLGGRKSESFIGIHVERVRAEKIPSNEAFSSFEIRY